MRTFFFSDVAAGAISPSKFHVNGTPEILTSFASCPSGSPFYTAWYPVSYKLLLHILCPFFLVVSDGRVNLVLGIPFSRKWGCIYFFAL